LCVAEHQLYKMIAEYLRSHPTTEESPLRLQLHGLPLPKDGKVPQPAIPKGFKIGTVLPLHSPALSGGGVSDNFLQDMMAEMGGELPEGMKGMANMGGGGGMAKPKKIRVGKK
jgi:signal recognition particle subunit SRP19